MLLQHENYENFSVIVVIDSCAVYDCTFTRILNGNIKTSMPLSIDSSIFSNLYHTTDACILSMTNNNLMFKKSCISSCTSAAASLLTSSFFQSQTQFQYLTLLSFSYCHASTYYYNLFYGKQTQESLNFSFDSSDQTGLYFDNMNDWKFQYVSLHQCKAAKLLFFDDPHVALLTPISDLSIFECLTSQILIRIVKGDGETITRLTMCRNKAPTSISSTGTIVIKECYVDAFYGTTNLLSFEDPYLPVEVNPTAIPGDFLDKCSPNVFNHNIPSFCNHININMICILTQSVVTHKENLFCFAVPKILLFFNNAHNGSNRKSNSIEFSFNF